MAIALAKFSGVLAENFDKRSAVTGAPTDTAADTRGDGENGCDGGWVNQETKIVASCGNNAAVLTVHCNSWAAYVSGRPGSILYLVESSSGREGRQTLFKAGLSHS
jgi:hypothetical protein